jgi:hypothetical protein
MTVYLAWDRYYPAIQEYDITDNAISFKSWNSDFTIPFKEIKEARYRHFKWGKPGFNRYAITIFHNGKTNELRFDSSNFGISKIYFDEIKMHIGGKAKDLR